nr:PREDICTED: coiled-coil domain-containing protein 18-like [Paralichthys olivaceus]
MTNLKRSEKDHQERHKKLQKQIEKMTADHKSNYVMIKKLKRELQSVENLKEELCELRLKNCEKDKEIQSLLFSIENLQSNNEAKGTTISMLQEKNTQWASDLREEQAKNVQLHYEAAVSQQSDKNEHVRLTGELEDALHKSRLAEMQHQQVRETCSRLQEQLKREKTHLSGALKKIAMQRRVSAATQGMTYEMETLRMENKNIRAKYEALEAKYDFQYKCRAPSPSESKTRQAQHQDDLQRSILEERVSQTASALERERDRLNQTASALERERERADQTFIALEKERDTLEKCNVKLHIALVQHTKALEEQHRLALALQKTQNKCQIQEQMNFQLRQANELKMKEQKVALHEATDALQNLQKEHTDLGKKHSEIHSNYREVLKSHSALQVRYERLGYATGDPQADLNQSKLNLDWCALGLSFHNSKPCKTLNPVHWN